MSHLSKNSLLFQWIKMCRTALLLHETIIEYTCLDLLYEMCSLFYFLPITLLTLLQKKVILYNQSYKIHMLKSLRSCMHEL